LARASLSPVTQAALTLQQWQPMALEQDINALVTELGAQAAAASSNKLARMEAMLTTQAHTLDLIFNELARRARQNINEYPEAFERYLRLSLKAQSQCRSTIEGLAELKNPKPVAFVQQANIANGPQQVNNGGFRPARARTGNRKPGNELLKGDRHGERLEYGKTDVPPLLSSRSV